MLVGWLSADGELFSKVSTETEPPSYRDMATIGYVNLRPSDDGLSAVSACLTSHLGRDSRKVTSDSNGDSKVPKSPSRYGIVYGGYNGTGYNRTGYVCLFYRPIRTQD